MRKSRRYEIPKQVWTCQRLGAGLTVRHSLRHLLILLGPLLRVADVAGHENILLLGRPTATISGPHA